MFYSWHCDETTDLRVEHYSDGERAFSGHCASHGLHMGRDRRPPDQCPGEEDPPAQPILTQLPETEQPHRGGKTLKLHLRDSN